jgi:tRNA nucleotidyltransferase (CCA-adding enzyme)
MEASTKIKDNLYYDERSAGGLVYKIENGKVLWLVVKYLSRGVKKKSGKHEAVYKFPKGHLKDNEVLKQAALREVEEEGRVKSKIVSKIGSNDYIIWDKLQKKKIIKKVTFFLMEYLGESNLKYYDIEVILDRVWMGYEEATEKLAFDSEKVLLRKAKIELETKLKKL